MMLFSKKRGEVGGERVGELVPFKRVVSGLKCIEIVAKTHHPEFAQAPSQAAIDHFALGFIQGNSGAGVDQLAYSGEIAIVHIEFAVFVPRLLCSHEPLPSTPRESAQSSASM